MKILTQAQQWPLRIATPIYRGVNFPAGHFPKGYEGDGIIDAGPMGTHWTTHLPVARDSTLADNGIGTNVVFTADWNGEGEDSAKTGTNPPLPGMEWKHEHEKTLHRGVTLPITSVSVHNPDTGDWEERLSEGYRGYEGET